MKPIARSESNDLDAARKMVSRAERRALERAERLRAEAEELLKLVADQSVDAEVKVRAEFEEQVRALREEMAEAGRRASVAEAELELLKVARAPQDQPRTRVVSIGGEEGRLAAAVDATAAQLRAQAEIELARAKEEAVGIIAAASRQAGDLLFSAMAAIENDTKAVQAARQQAEEDTRAAAEIRSELQVALGQAKQDAARIREDGIVTRDRVVDEAAAESRRIVEEARAESARLMDGAEAEAAKILEAARVEANRVAQTSSPDLERARAEADRMVAAARQEAAEALNAVRRQLLAEMLGLRDAMDQTRESFTQFLESSAADPAPPDRAVGSW